MRSRAELDEAIARILADALVREIRAEAAAGKTAAPPPQAGNGRTAA